MVLTFLRTPLMALELLIAEYIFSIQLKKKPYFYLRFFILSFVVLIATFWIEFFYFIITNSNFVYIGSETSGESIFKFFYYLLIFIMTLLVLKGSYETSFYSILYYGANGFALQHLAIEFLNLFILIPGLANSLETYPYLTILYECLSCLIFYIPFLIYMYRKKDETLSLTEKNARRKIITSIIIVFVCIGLSRITTDNLERNLLSSISENIMMILICFLLLFSLRDLTKQEKIQSEVDLMTEILHQEREQYKLSKENIELINIKCHDLKHQIRLQRDNLNIEEIENAIKIYDSTVKTGNDVLDTILTEKSLFCERNKIMLNCVGNSKDLVIMDKSDIYSLFGNIVQNAIDSVNEIEDLDKRFIKLDIHSQKGMLLIREENYFKEKPKFENGIPITQKDKKFHGFGVKSMMRVVKKYDGVLTFKLEDERFVLNIALPLKD